MRSGPQRAEGPGDSVSRAERGRGTQSPVAAGGAGPGGAGPGGGGAGGTWVRSRRPAPSHFRVPRRRSPRLLQPRSPERPPAPARRAEARATPHWPLDSSQSAPRRPPSARAKEPPARHRRRDPWRLPLRREVS
ncbi:uncharacterized protein LOC144339243 [Macaca mulatta]